MKEDPKDVTIEYKKKLEHLSNLVRLSLADQIINHDEQKFLDSYADYLGISTEEYHAVLLHPEKYQFNIPTTQNERIKRLYYLAKLSFEDREVLTVEIDRMEKIAINLGFEKAEKLVKKAVHLIINTYDLEDFEKIIEKLLEE